MNPEVVLPKDGKLNHSKDLILPTLDHSLIDFCRALGCSWVGAVPVFPKPHCRYWDCHNNTLNYTSWYGGERVLGYYLLECCDTHNMGAILHSVVRTRNGKLIDITPFDDNRPINMFAILKNQIPDYTRQEIWSSHLSRDDHNHNLQT